MQPQERAQSREPRLLDERSPIQHGAPPWSLEFRFMHVRATQFPSRLVTVSLLTFWKASLHPPCDGTGHRAPVSGTGNGLETVGYDEYWREAAASFDRTATMRAWGLSTLASAPQDRTQEASSSRPPASIVATTDPSA